VFGEGVRGPKEFVDHARKALNKRLRGLTGSARGGGERPSKRSRAGAYSGVSYSELQRHIGISKVNGCGVSWPFFLLGRLPAATSAYFESIGCSGDPGPEPVLPMGSPLGA